MLDVGETHPAATLRMQKMLRQKGTKSGVPFTVLIEPVPEELRTALQERVRAKPGRAARQAFAPISFKLRRVSCRARQL